MKMKQVFELLVAGWSLEHLQLYPCLRLFLSGYRGRWSKLFFLETKRRAMAGKRKLFFLETGRAMVVG